MLPSRAVNIHKMLLECLNDLLLWVGVCRFRMYVCLWFFVPLENFWLIWKRHHYLYSKGLQNLTYARHWRPLINAGSLTCHTYWDTGHPFIMVISENPWHSYLMPSAYHWRCQFRFLWIRFVKNGIRTPDLPLARLTP